MVRTDVACLDSCGRSECEHDLELTGSVSGSPLQRRGARTGGSLQSGPSLEDDEKAGEEREVLSEYEGDISTAIHSFRMDPSLLSCGVQEMHHRFAHYIDINAVWYGYGYG